MNLWQFKRQRDNQPIVVLFWNKRKKITLKILWFWPWHPNVFNMFWPVKKFFWGEKKSCVGFSHTILRYTNRLYLTMFSLRASTCQSSTGHKNCTTILKMISLFCFSSLPNGNCLYSSISLHLVGNNSLMDTLRCLARVQNFSWIVSIILRTKKTHPRSLVDWLSHEALRLAVTHSQPVII